MVSLVIYIIPPTYKKITKFPLEGRIKPDVCSNVDIVEIGFHVKCRDSGSKVKRKMRKHTTCGNSWKSLTIKINTL